MVVDVSTQIHHGPVELLDLAVNPSYGIIELRYHLVPCSVNPLNILALRFKIGLYVKQVDGFRSNRGMPVAQAGVVTVALSAGFWWFQIQRTAHPQF